MKQFADSDQGTILDMEQEERILTFIESMGVRNTAFLQKKEKEALDEGIPIIRTQTQSLLKFMLDMIRPENILEVGTATGFSAMFLSTCAPYARITTIERDEERAAKARIHFEEGREEGSFPDKITLLEGDAAQILKTLEGKYQMIFMDAAKGQYIHFLPEVKRLMDERAVLISDNIFKEGEILQSRFAVKRRNRTIHKRMREYLEALNTDPEFTTLLLQEGDGAALTVRGYTNLC